MFEKKIFVLNCDICDARKMKEEDYAGYEEIVLNADMLIVSEESKSILARLPMTANVDETLELDKDISINLQEVNGNHEISSKDRVPEYTLLSINGDLKIMPGAEEALKNYWRISINGNVTYPKSLEASLKGLSINGDCNAYPDDCIILEDSFNVDKYFPLRAREGGRYYAKEEVIFGDEEADISKLVKKEVQFVTGQVLVLEKLVEKAIPLFDERVKLTVIPEGEVLIVGDVTLTEELVAEKGERLFIHGNLNITEESATALNRLKKLTVEKTLFIRKSMTEALKAVDVTYGDLQILRKIVENKVSMTVDAALLAGVPEGLLIRNIAKLKICEDVTPEAILDCLSVENCATVHCAPNQKSATEAVCKNIYMVKTGEEEEKQENEGEGFFGKVKTGLGILKDTKVVNADKYVL